MVVFLKGFGIGIGLIAAIGAQNAFVLSHGVRRNHMVIIPLICSVCDAVLVVFGVTGIGAAVASNTIFTSAATWGGALFLFCYGVKAFQSARNGGSLDANAENVISLRAAILATLAVTLLNPHVYLDTLLLVGSISGQYPESERIRFGAGVVCASIIWFFSLSLGGRLLAPVFRKPAAWRILDTAIGIIMWTISFSLVCRA